MSATIRAFGRQQDGREVQAVELRGGGLRATILTRGAILQDLRLDGVDWPLTLGAPDIAAYEGPMAYFGAIVGPVANRIAGAQAEINDRICRFEANDGDGTVTLHGGSTGIHGALWDIAEAAADRLVLRLELADGLGGFPGNRRIGAEFSLAAPARLTIRLWAETNADTLINLTNHSYWNLDGGGGIAGQRLRVAANRYVVLDPLLVPTGRVADVAGTAFDLRAGRVLEESATFDVNLCVADAPRPLTDVADLTGRSGVRLRLATTEPGLQVYDMARVDTGFFAGHHGGPYGSFAGLALEAQRWPDAPHHAHFPSILLKAGERCEQLTELRFDRT